MSFHRIVYSGCPKGCNLAAAVRQRLAAHAIASHAPLLNSGYCDYAAHAILSWAIVRRSLGIGFSCSMSHTPTISGTSLLACLEASAARSPGRREIQTVAEMYVCLCNTNCAVTLTCGEDTGTAIQELNVGTMITLCTFTRLQKATWTPAASAVLNHFCHGQASTQLLQRISVLQ